MMQTTSAAMPRTADKIFSQLNTKMRDYDDLGRFGLYPSGNKVTDDPEILFARMKLEDVLEKIKGLDS